MTIFEYQAWYANPWIQLGERLIFAQTLRYIGELINHDDAFTAKDVYRWKRSDENLFDFNRRSGYIPAFWDETMREYRDALRPAEGIPRPAKRPRRQEPSPVNAQDFGKAETGIEEGDSIGEMPVMFEHDLRIDELMRNEKYLDGTVEK